MKRKKIMISKDMVKQKNYMIEEKKDLIKKKKELERMKINK